MISTGKNFYPTPRTLIEKMVSKVKGEPSFILEPSAGKGDIIEYLKDDSMWSKRRRYPLSAFSAIENDEDLQATLRGKGIKIIDNDFLTYAGPDKFDLIIGNPPFDTGDQHLMKAIEILYRGEIVFLLNAETIRNPNTKVKQVLAKKLKDLNAEIEFIKDAFLVAERPTKVEVALIHIQVEKNIEEDLFDGVTEAEEKRAPKLETYQELSTGKTIEELVAEYNQIVTLGTETIISYFRHYKKISPYLGLNREVDKYSHGEGDMTDRMQAQLNALLIAVRKDFWSRTLELSEVRKRMTSKKRSEFEHQVQDRCNMDFTEFNIRQFVLNLMAGHEKTLTEAVLDIFDMFTIRHSYHEELHNDNIHYFNGWKTNKAYKVNKKVIIPIYAGYADGPFVDYGKWKLNYQAAATLSDIDIVMNYFDGCGHYCSISRSLEAAFERGQSSRVHSTYFTLTAYKKGTLHLTFNDEDILRRFNVVACMGKSWLPHDYGRKPYEEAEPEVQLLIESFEGRKSYETYLNQPAFGPIIKTPALPEPEIQPALFGG